MLSGCVPKRYSKSQEEELVQACLPAVNEFLAKHCGEYELGELHLQEGLIEPENTLLGRFGSNVVRETYTVAGNTWDLVYNRETGIFYTGELLEKLKEKEEARILEYLKDELPEEDLRDFELTALDINYLVRSHDIRIDSNTTADTYVYISYRTCCRQGSRKRICLNLPREVSTAASPAESSAIITATGSML